MFLSAPPARASCVNPTGNAGDFRYYGGFQTPEYCDGAGWVAMGPVGDVRTGLLGWWKFDEGSGTAANDSSGNGHTGTLTNGGGGLPTWATGISGNALSFDGGNYVGWGNVTAMNSLSAITVSAWVNTTNNSVIVTKSTCLGGSGQGPFELYVGDVGAGKASFVVYPAGGSPASYEDSGDSTTNVADGSWHFMVGEYDGSKVSVWVDGSLQNSNTFGAVTLTSTTYPFNVEGCNNGASGTATVDDVRVYNRALTAQDIHTLYTSTGPLSGDIQSNLVGWWKLDDGSSGTTPTTAVDSTGNGNTGTNVGSPTWGAGKINNALTFNGTSQYVNVGTPSVLNLTTTGTISAWVKYGAQSGSWNVIAGSVDSNLDQTGYSLVAYPSNHLSVEVGDGSGYEQPTSPLAYDDNNWHLVTGTWDGITVKTYVDGALVASAAQSHNATSGHNFNIGRDDHAANYYFNGLIDDVRVYSRALSASDVLTLYNTYATACASPVGYAGDLLYNANSHVYQFCNDSNWIPLGPVPGPGGSGCTGGSERDLIYNKDKGYMQYCDGTNWIAIGQSYYGPQTGLVGWWKLDDGSGTSAIDSSGSGNTGTTQNSPTWTTSGQVNSALTFNGTNQYVGGGDPASLELSGSWTVSAWVNPSALPASGAGFPLVTKHTIHGGPNYGIYLDNGNSYFTFGAGLGWGASFQDSSASFLPHVVKYVTSVSTGTWYHVVGVWDNSAQNLSLYLNGALVATQNVPGVSPTTGPGRNFDIGTENDGSTGGFTAGTIDDVRLYNRALSASEVWQLYLVTGGQ